MTKRLSKVTFATRGGRFKILRTTTQRLKEQELVIGMNKCYFPAKGVSPEDIAEALYEINQAEHDLYVEVAAEKTAQGLTWK